MEEKEFRQIFKEHIEYLEKRFGKENVKCDAFDYGHIFVACILNGMDGDKQFRAGLRLANEENRATLQQCEEFADKYDKANQFYLANLGKIVSIKEYINQQLDYVSGVEIYCNVPNGLKVIF